MSVSTDLLVALSVGGLLLVLTLPLAGWVKRHEGDSLGRVVKWGLVVKLLAAPVQLWVASRFYGNVADFNLYHGLGRRIAPGFPDSLFAVEGGRIIGIRFIGMITGTLYSFTGVNKLAGFFVFSWFGFLGQYLFFRAFRTGVPEGDAFRYALFIFFLPSIVFWPSSIGKDAWMCLALGLAALGCARLIMRRRGGFTMAGAGLAAGCLVRPHVVLLVFLAVSIAYLVRKPPRTTSFDLAARIGGMTVLLVAGLLLVGTVERFFSVDSSGTTALDQVLDTTSKNSQGHFRAGEEAPDTGFGSSFDPSEFRSPLRFPKAFVTVLFRPWPFEAANLPALLASLEGLVLLGLLAVSRRRVLGAVRMFRQRAYVLAVSLYSVLFVYFFAAIGNFGILARQKVQVLPFFLVLLALPRPEQKSHASPLTESIPSTTRSTS